MRGFATLGRELETFVASVPLIFLLEGLQSWQKFLWAGTQPSQLSLCVVCHVGELTYSVWILRKDPLSLVDLVGISTRSVVIK